jgi:hypothetical protein
MTHEAWSEIRPHLTLFGTGPVNMNTVSSQTLRILGVSESVSTRILDYRATHAALLPTDPASLEEPFRDLGDLKQKIGVSPEEDTELQNIASVFGFRSDTFRFFAYADDASTTTHTGYDCVLTRKGALLSLQDARR